jgi:DNA-binding MurR/RpiR family transcriptional regulator
MPAAESIRSYEVLTDIARKTFAEMSPQFQTAMQFVLDHPDEVAVSSMRTIAGRSGVQPATLVRLAQSLGFAGWLEFRQLFVDRLRARPEPYAAKARALLTREPTKELAAEMFRAHRSNLEHTEAQIRPDLLQAARALKRARTVHVAGFRACYSLAFAFQYVYRLFRSSVTLLGGEGGTLEMQVRAIEHNDAVLVISFAPYSTEARRVAEAAREVGAKLVVLTDSVVAPIALDADVRLLFSVSSPSFFPSQVGGVAAVESLLEMLVLQSGDASVRQIADSERQLYQSGAYEQPSTRLSRSRPVRRVGRRPVKRSAP